MLIVNPAAGKGQHRTEIAAVLDVLCSRGAAVTVYRTRHKGHARTLTREHAAEYDIISCMGGDGTLGETIAGLMDIDCRPPVGYIPMGTANDMANTLSLPKNGRRAAQVILGGHTIPIDVGCIDEEYFTYISAFGAFTQVSYKTPQGTKAALGHFAYVLEGMSELTKITPRKLVVAYDNNKTIEGEFIFGSVTNTTSIAGLVRLKTELVDLGDGEFEVILVKNPRNILDVNSIFMGIVMQKYDPRYVQIFRTKDVRFIFEEPVAWTRDGEDGGMHQDISMHAVPSAVQIFVPEGTV